MAKIILGAERRQADRIIRCLPRNKVVAECLGNSQQKQQYRTTEVYPKLLTECIKILDLAGYEIKEKEV